MRFYAIAVLSICLFSLSINKYAADAPIGVSFKVRVVRSSDAIDPKTGLLDVRSMRTK
jgi:hypothetical protein